MLRKPVKKTIELPSKVGFVDTNIGLDHALSVANRASVYYFLASKSAFPTVFDEMSGFGFKNINIVDCYGAIEELDFIIFTDVFFGKEVEFLRSLNKNVFGAPYFWTRMENEKIFSYRETEKLGIQTPKSTVLKGLENFLSFMKSNKNFPVFVKVNKYRGNIETTKINSYEEAVVMCLNSNMGPFILDEEFLVQQPCSGVELGFDILFNGKEFIKPFCFTIEVKGQGNITKFVESNLLDAEIFNKIKKSLSEYNYRGNISLEFFYDGNQIVAIDWTARLPFPCSSIQAKVVENWPEVLYAVACGKDITLKVKKQYAAQIGLYTDNVIQPRPIHFPKKYEKNIGFRRVAKIKNDLYYICNDPLVAVVVDSGDSVEEALDNVYDIAAEIEFSDAVFPSSFESDVFEIISKLENFGSALVF